MIVISPIQITGEGATRASTATYINSAGKVAVAAVNELRFNYDPLDLDAPPVVLVERAPATNFLFWSEEFDNAVWTKAQSTITANSANAPSGAAAADKLVEGSSTAGHYMYQVATGAANTKFAWSVYAKAGERRWLGMSAYDGASHFAFFDLLTGVVGTVQAGNSATIEAMGDGWYLCSVTRTTGATTVAAMELYVSNADNSISHTGDGVSGLYLWGAQFGKASSYIPTVGAAATRAADVLGTGTLLYSNVPENEYPAHNMGAAYVVGNRVISAHKIYEAVADGTGHAVTDTAYWVFVSATNQRKMFDDINNTATENPDVIRVALQARAVAGGLYLGGVSAYDVRATMVEPNGTTVYASVDSMIQEAIGSSYYNWMFSRITRRNAVVKVDLPAYYDGLLMVEIRNPSATAAVAMMSFGPAEKLGITDYGVSRDITDYSTEAFDSTGASTTVLRGYSKGMDLDITIDNTAIDAVVDAVENYRQKSVVWIAEEDFKHTVVFGKYASFKTVIVNYPDSRMSLSIKGKI